MPRQSGQRRPAVPRRKHQDQDDRADEQAPLEELWAHEAKRARRQQRTRRTLEIALDVVQGINSWWP